MCICFQSSCCEMHVALFRRSLLLAVCTSLQVGLSGCGKSSVKTSSWQRDASCQILATVAPSCRFSSVSRPLRKLRNDCIIEMRRNGDVGAPSVAISDRISQCDHSLTETLLLRGVARGVKPCFKQCCVHMRRTVAAFRVLLHSLFSERLMRNIASKMPISPQLL